MADYPNPQAAWQKASSIGPAQPGTMKPLRTPVEESDPIRKLIELSGFADPFGLSEGSSGGVANLPAGIGGLPEGLNPHAIGEMLKREGMQVFDDAAEYAPKAINVAKGAGMSAIAGLKAAARSAADKFSQSNALERELALERQAMMKASMGKK